MGAYIMDFSGSVKALSAEKRLLPNNYYKYKDILTSNTNASISAIADACKYIKKEVIDDAEGDLDLSDSENIKTIKQRVRRKFEKLPEFPYINPADFFFIDYNKYIDRCYKVFTSNGFNYTEFDIIVFYMHFVVCYLEFEKYGTSRLSEEAVEMLFKKGEQGSVPDLAESLITILSKEIVERNVK